MRDAGVEPDARDDRVVRNALRLQHFLRELRQPFERARRDVEQELLAINSSSGEVRRAHHSHAAAVCALLALLARIRYAATPFIVGAGGTSLADRLENVRVRLDAVRAPAVRLAGTAFLECSFVENLGEDRVRLN